MKISRKYEVASNKLFNSLIQAWEDAESTCENLKIVCRKKTSEYGIFLITTNGTVVAQLPIPRRVLQDPHSTENLLSLEKLLIEIEPKRLQIKNLKAKMKRINLTARVLEIPKPKLISTRFGRQIYITNVLIADKTGVIRMNLLGKLAEMISVNDVIRIRNSHVIIFMGKPQLRIGRYGKVEVIKDAEFPSAKTLKAHLNHQ